jgi:hypothetical protein
MTKIKCMLVIFIISTGYLFSQGEGNEIIDEDTITLANTAVVTEVDTVVIEEFASEPGEKVDLSNYGFYNDYLDYIKKTNSMADIGDTNVFIPKREKLGMLVLETGVALSPIGPERPIISLAGRAPVSRYFHILLKHARAPDSYSSYSIMLGYSFFIKRSIIDISVGLCFPFAHGKLALNFETVEEHIGSSIDIAYYYRVSKDVVFSATIGSDGYMLISSLSLGVGHTLSF